MNTTKKTGREFSYQALSYAQRGRGPAASFVLFHAAATDIIEWADVDRLTPDNRTGAQRPLRELKVAKVARFLAEDVRNTIPTAVVIALDSGATKFKGTDSTQGVGRHGIVTISTAARDKPGLIIDGQHRVFGSAQYDPHLHLNVVAFLGGDDAERAFQFVVINNSVTRVTKDHIKALNLSFNREQLNDRLVKSAGLALALDEQKFDDLQTIDRTEPFKGLIQWPTNAAGFIPPSAVESALAETRDRATLIGIEELELDVFLAIWKKIRELRAGIWDKFPVSRLLLKVSIWALTVYILDAMVAKQRNEDVRVDFTAIETLSGLVERVVGRIPDGFWTSDWKLTELDTALGRQTMLDALAIIDSNVRFSRPWYDKVPLIDPSLLDGKSSGARRTTKAGKGRQKPRANRK